MFDVINIDSQSCEYSDPGNLSTLSLEMLNLIHLLSHSNHLVNFHYLLIQSDFFGKQLYNYGTVINNVIDINKEESSALCGVHQKSVRL